MNIKTKHVVIGNLHKVLVLDQDNTKEEGKLIFFSESLSKAEAINIANDFVKALVRSSEETVWN